MRLTSGNYVMLRTYSERLVFHAYSETTYPFCGFSVLPDNTEFESSYNGIKQGWQTCGPRGKYLRPSVTRIASVIQFNKRNVVVLQNIVWQLY